MDSKNGTELIYPKTLNYFMAMKCITAKELAIASDVSERTIRDKSNSKNLTESIQRAILHRLATTLGTTAAELTRPVGATSILGRLAALSDQELIHQIAQASASGHGEIAQFLFQAGVARSPTFPNGAGDTLIRVVDQDNQELEPELYSTVHRNGLMHRTVILLLSQSPGTLVVQYRHSDVLFAGQLDAFGGHETPGDRSSLETALREANSELRQSIGNNPLAWSLGQLRRLGQEYSFTIDSPLPHGGNNREFSSVYLMRAPVLGCTFHYQEDTESGYVVETPETNNVGLDELLYQHEKDSGRFADGLGRVLTKVAQDAKISEELRQWLQW